MMSAQFDVSEAFPVLGRVEKVFLKGIWKIRKDRVEIKQGIFHCSQCELSEKLKDYQAIVDQDDIPARLYVGKMLMIRQRGPVLRIVIVKGEVLDIDYKFEGCSV